MVESLIGTDSMVVYIVSTSSLLENSNVHALFLHDASSMP